MRQFEYKAVSVYELEADHRPELSVDKLNELGKDRWELVTILNGKCIFKREKRERGIRMM